jgi:predicted nucleic acid-binding protein
VGQSDLLAQLFGEVIIPPAVQAELSRTHSCLPPWLRIQPVRNLAEAARLFEVVDMGEAEAIALAKELQSDWLLMDERKGRCLATQEGLSIIGLVGVVLLAKKRSLIPSARALLDRLENRAGIYLSRDIRVGTRQRR